MKNFFIIVSLLIIYTGCSSYRLKNNVIDKNDEIYDNSLEEKKSMKMIINNEEYSVELENNQTVDALIKLMPLNLEMTELNGNEKYVYLNNTLPTNSSNPGYINKGDIMLFGNNCLVLFYKSFDTTYSYTKIGHISNLSDLDDGNIIVQIK